MRKRSQPARALVQALEAIRYAAQELDAAIDGTTDEFNAELRRLRQAAARADRALARAKGGAS
jgi:hypothetical protein